MKTKNVFANLDDILACICMVTVIAVTLLGVIMRYFVNNPLAWIEEVSLFFFVWVALLGSATVMKGEEHVSIDFLVKKLSPHVRKIVDIIGAIVVVTSLIIIIKNGLQLALQANDKVTPILRVPYLYIDIAIPLGLFGMLIYYVKFNLLKSPQDNLDLNKGDE